MFQDILPYSFNNDFSWTEPEPVDRVLIYRGSSVVAKRLDREDGVLRFPSYGELALQGVLASGDKTLDDHSSVPDRIDGEPLSRVFLFQVGRTAYFRCEIEEEVLDGLLGLPEDVSSGCSEGRYGADAVSQRGGRTANSPCSETLEGASCCLGKADGPCYELVPIAELRTLGPKHRVFAGLVGYEYHVWYDTHRYCGRCSAKMRHGTVERMLKCPDCGCMEFSRLFPAVIVGVVDRQRDKVLVSRYSGRPFNAYALIAGFCEMGETVEQTVHREVMEEVGLKVSDLRYYKSQPWPPSSSLLFGFFCDLEGDDSITLDDHELEEAQWIDREDLPDDEDYSLTRDMMGVLRRREETRYPVI